MKNKRGITLVALIITIIVLLILAGVVINMALGNDGIITKAQSAVNAYKNAQEQEEALNVVLGDTKENYSAEIISRELDSRVKQNTTITNMTGSTFKINVNSVDANNATKLYYYLDGNLIYEGTENSYTVTGLEDNSEHEVMVLAEKNPMKVITNEGDNINSWLACIGNTKKLSLEEIASDRNLIEDLFTNNDAIEYFNKSTEIIKPNLTQELVPQKTSNENILYDTAFNQSNMAPYLAFDRSLSGNGWVSNSMSTGFIGYNFGKKVVVFSAEFINSPDWRINEYVLQYSDNNSTWTDASNKKVAYNDNSSYNYVQSNTYKAHQYWRIYFYNTYRDYGGLSELQFYGI